MRIQTLSLVVQAGCGAGCPFCIARQTPAVAAADKEQLFGAALRGLRKAFRLAEIGGCTTVLITSKGEPLNNPDQIEDYLRKADESYIPLVELQTNGLAFQRMGHAETLERWRRIGLTTVAISCVGINDKLNQDIYDPKGTLTMPGYKLEHAVRVVLAAGLMCRLTVTMFKGGVDSAKAVNEVIDYCRDNGIHQVTFGEVVGISQTRNAVVSNWAEEHRLGRGYSIDIGDAISDRGRDILSLMHGGLVWDVDGVAVCLRECLSTSKRIEEIRSLIYWPNGQVTYDWNYKAARLI